MATTKNKYVFIEFKLIPLNDISSKFLQATVSVKINLPISLNHKQKLITFPILSYLDFKLSFIVQSDASDTAIENLLGHAQIYKEVRSNLLREQTTNKG